MPWRSSISRRSVWVFKWVCPSWTHRILQSDACKYIALLWLPQTFYCILYSPSDCCSFCHSGGEAQTDRAHTKWEKDSPGCQFSFFGAVRVLIQGKDLKKWVFWVDGLVEVSFHLITTVHFGVFYMTWAVYIIKLYHIFCYVLWNTSCGKHQPWKGTFSYTLISISNSLKSIMNDVILLLFYFYFTVTVFYWVKLVWTKCTYTHLHSVLIPA